MQLVKLRPRCRGLRFKDSACWGVREVPGLMIWRARDDWRVALSNWHRPLVGLQVARGLRDQRFRTRADALQAIEALLCLREPHSDPASERQV